MDVIQRILLTQPIPFFLVLGILVFFHEAGHFLMAKLFRVRVDVFSFGFGKRLIGFKAGGTDYRISLIPLGGYVSMGGEQPEENHVPSPDEFLAKPKWQRFLILFAGPLMNLLIAVGFIAGIDMHGTRQRQATNIVDSVTPGDPAARAGLRRGDRIVSIDGEPMADFDDLKLAISMHGGTQLSVTYVRDGQTLTTTMTPRREDSDYGPVGRAGIAPYEEPIVGDVATGSVAAKAGLRPGDRITALNGKPVFGFSDIEKTFIESKGAPMSVEVARGGARVPTTLGAIQEADVTLRGFMPRAFVRKFGFGEAIADSLVQNWKMVKLTGTSVRRLVVGNGSMKELSGPLRIAQISKDVMQNAGVLGTLAFMAMISLQLGIMNLLPIPVLDGGHIMVLLVEGAARRELSLRVKERIQYAGLIALATLMLVVVTNDVIVFATKKAPPQQRPAPTRPR